MDEYFGGAEGNRKENRASIVRLSSESGRIGYAEGRRKAKRQADGLQKTGERRSDR